MKKSDQGFSLIEVLVAMLVLALGVIGAAGMHLTALRTSQQSAFQTVATQLASEMAESIRANSRLTSLDDTNNPYLAIDFRDAGDGESIGGDASCYQGNCGTTNLADFDSLEWQARIQKSLPGGRVRVCRDSNPWNSGTGAFVWNCTPGPDAPIAIKIGWHGKGVKPDGRPIENGDDMPPGVVLAMASH